MATTDPRPPTPTPNDANDALDALDAATTAIASELSLDRVLQVIVDRIRPLVGARYAALGIVDRQGGIERFITSGIDDEMRRRIGPPPRGHGLLGLIIREQRSIRVPDIMVDPGRYGFPAHHPVMHSFLGVPVLLDGTGIGNLYLTEKQGAAEFSDGDQRLVQTFARHAGIAIHNARLHAELQALNLLEERERIGRDLHDGIIQALYAVSLSLEDVADLMTTHPAEAAERVERVIDSIHAAIRDVRSFIFGLRPEQLEDVDLADGLAHLADELRRSGHAVDLDAPGRVELEPDVAIQLIQLAREALSNVVRHAGADHIRVELLADDDGLCLTIMDDGRGFDPAAASVPGHHGLDNMRGRAGSLGASLDVQSDPGNGTRVMVRLPLVATARRQEART